MTLGIHLQKTPCPFQGHMLANAGHDILQRAPFRRVIEHIIDRNQWHTNSFRETAEKEQSSAVAPAMEHGRRKPQPVTQLRQEMGKHLFGFITGVWRRHHRQQQPFLMLQQIVQSEDTITFLCTKFPFAD